MWASLTKEKRLSKGPRPFAEDTLLGSAYIPLSDVVKQESVGGSYPLFKAGVDSLGGQTLHVEIHKMILSDEGTSPQDPLAHRNSCCIEILVCINICVYIYVSYHLVSM